MAGRFTIAFILAILASGHHLVRAQGPLGHGADDFQFVKLVADEEKRASLLASADAANVSGMAAHSGYRLAFDLSVTPRDYSFAELLFHNDVSPLARDYAPASAMLLALGLHDLKLVERLLDRGIDVNIALDHPIPAGLIALFENPFIVRELTKDTRVTPLMLAVLSKQPEAVRVLIRHGANTEICTRGLRMYPLDFAAELKDIALMQLLLHREPSPDGQGRHIIISLFAQRAWLMNDSNVLFETQVSTGRPGFSTHTGEFVVTQKYPEWRSTLYKAPMPNFMRLNCSQAGLHGGYVPGVPASHGCIRLPPRTAELFYSIVRLGDRVSIVD